jgi:hypothetical protein
MVKDISDHRWPLFCKHILKNNVINISTYQVIHIHILYIFAKNLFVVDTDF